MIRSYCDPDVGGLMSVVDVVDGDVVAVLHTEPFTPGDDDSVADAWFRCLDAEARHLAALARAAVIPPRRLHAARSSRRSGRDARPAGSRVDPAAVAVWVAIAACSSLWLFGLGIAVSSFVRWITGGAA